MCLHDIIRDMHKESSANLTIERQIFKEIFFVVLIFVRKQILDKIFRKLREIRALDYPECA